MKSISKFVVFSVAGTLILSMNVNQVLADSDKNKDKDKDKNKTKTEQAQQVPEPFTILGSGVALGVGALMHRKNSKHKTSKGS